MPTATETVKFAVALRSSHSHAPALDVLDLVFSGVDIATLVLDAEATAPWTPFGQLIAEAFDRGMTPEEWVSLTRRTADPILVAALLEIWGTQVMSRFAARFCAAGDRSVPPDEKEARRRIAVRTL